MKNLKRYIEQKNAWTAIFGNRALVLPEDAGIILSHIEGDLSPENLCMDGEADPAYVRKQLTFLTAAKAELEEAYPQLVR